MKKSPLTGLIIVIVLILIAFILVNGSDTINNFLSETFSTETMGAEIVCYGDDKSCQLEKEIHDFVNFKREENQLLVLTHDSLLSEIARNHSQDMIDREFMGHINPDALDVSDRGEFAGYKCKKYHGLMVESGLAENLYQTSLYDKGIIIGDNESNPFFTWNSVENIADKTVNSWIESEGHRKNLFNEGYTREGIGVAIDSENNVYVTQVFC